jgi:hypothetical protein
MLIILYYLYRNDESSTADGNFSGFSERIPALKA